MKSILTFSRFTFILLSSFFAFSVVSNAQNTNISGIINRYAAVSAIDTCLGKISIPDTTGFRKGNNILLFQMKGARIHTANEATYGTILDMNNCGYYERAIIDSVAAGALFVRHRLAKTYNAPIDLVQVMTFPLYSNATITGTIRPEPWNGTTGGIVALEVTGTLTMNAAIIADTCGFRGGPNFVATSNNCYFLFQQNAFFYDALNWRGAPKGEGIAEFLLNKENGRGAQANGGGGANDHNAGGGGGANVSNGGIGGFNDDPDALSCQGLYPGVGGRKITDKTGRLFLGGGGGGGHTNNTSLKSYGGRGGGIVVLLAGNIAGSNPTISANGQSCPPVLGDGGGGGGAGGTILCKVNAVPANFLMQANGGKGGDTRSNSNRCFGPGGGGSGGRILSNQSGTALGGASGLITLSDAGCQGSNAGAVEGQIGASELSTNIPKGNTLILPASITTNPMDQTVCEGDEVQFTCAAVGTYLGYQWQVNTGGIWSDVPAGMDYYGTQTNTLTIPVSLLSQNGYRFRCVAKGGDCFSLNTTPAHLTVLPDPIAAFTANAVGQTVVFSNQSMHYTSILWDFGDNLFSTEVSPTHSFVQEGSYTVKLTLTGLCGTASITQVVSLSVPPTAAFAVEDTLRACGSVMAQFINQSTNNANYQWLFPGGSPATSIQKNPQVTYSISGNYTATLNVSTASGTDATTRSFYVQILQSPTSAFNFSLQNNGVAQFDNLSTFGNAYLWNFGDGNTSNSAAPSHHYAEGTYNVTLTVTNACGMATFSLPLTFTNPPISNFSLSGDQSACDEVVIDFTSEASSNAAAIQWFFPGGSPASSNQAQVSVTYNTSDTYNAYLVATNSAGVDTFATNVVVEVMQAPVVAYSSTVTGNVLELANQTQFADTYLWDFGDNVTSNLFSPSHVYDQEGTYTVTLTASNACGTITKTRIITVSVMPIAAFAVEDTLTGCGNVVVQFINQSTDNATYLWQFPGGTPTTSTQKNPTVTYTSTGNYAVALLASNAAGTDAAAQSFFVKILQNPMPAFDFNLQNNGTAQFNNLSTNADAYFWDFGDGNTSTLQNPVHTFEEGDYTVTLSVTNPCGTISTVQMLQYITAPMASFSQNGNLTACGEVVLDFVAMASTNATAIQWIFPGGSPASSTQANVSVTYSNSGSFMGYLVASNSVGVDTFSSTFSVEILEDPIPAFGFDVSGNTVQFSNQSQYANTFSWDFGDGNSSNMPAPAHTYAQEGMYTVTLSATNACGTLTMMQTIHVANLPSAGFSVADTTSNCTDVVVGFTNNSSANTSTWQWAFPGGNPSTSNQQNPSITYSNSGNYTATLIVSNTQGNDTLSLDFVVQKLSAPLAGFDYLIGANGFVEFTNQSSPAIYQWNFGDGSNPVATANPTHQFEESGTYTITLQAITPCGASVIQKVITVTVVGTEELGVNHFIRAYPNPSHGSIFIEVDKNLPSPVAITVTNAIGQNIWGKQYAIEYIEKIETTTWAKGVYWAIVQLENGQKTAVEIVKL